MFLITLVLTAVHPATEWLRQAIHLMDIGLGEKISVGAALAEPLI